MIKLNEGNVLLKPSQRRQLMGWLKRSSRLGKRIGDFAVTIHLQRCGNMYEVRASVHDAAGDFKCRSRRTDWRTALRELSRTVSSRLHDQCLLLAAA